MPPLPCQNCPALIGPLETPCVWRDKIVCGACHAKLSTLPAVLITCPVCHEERTITLHPSTDSTRWVYRCHNPACTAMYAITLAYDVELIEKPKRQWFTPGLAE